MDKLLIETIRYSLYEVRGKIYAIIQDHKDHGLTVELNYKYNDLFVIVKIYHNKKLNCIISDDYIRQHKVKKAQRTKCAIYNHIHNIIELLQPEKDDFSMYINIFSCQVKDKEKFCNIVNLFLVRPRQARPINRIDLVDIGIICKTD